MATLHARYGNYTELIKGINPDNVTYMHDMSECDYIMSMASKANTNDVHARLLALQSIDGYNTTIHYFATLDDVCTICGKFNDSDAFDLNDEDNTCTCPICEDCNSVLVYSDHEYTTCSCTYCITCQKNVSDCTCNDCEICGNHIDSCDCMPCDDLPRDCVPCDGCYTLTAIDELYVDSVALAYCEKCYDMYAVNEDDSADDCLDYASGDIVAYEDYAELLNAWINPNGTVFYVEYANHHSTAIKLGFNGTHDAESHGYVHYSSYNGLNSDRWWYIPESLTNAQFSTMLSIVAAHGNSFKIPAWVYDKMQESKDINTCEIKAYYNPLKMTWPKYIRELAPCGSTLSSALNGD